MYKRKEEKEKEVCWIENKTTLTLLPNSDTCTCVALCSVVVCMQLVYSYTYCVSLSHCRVSFFISFSQLHRYEKKSYEKNWNLVRDACNKSGTIDEAPSFFTPEGQWNLDLNSVVGTAVVAGTIGMKMPKMLDTNVVKNFLQCDWKCAGPVSVQEKFKLRLVNHTKVRGSS